MPESEVKASKLTSSVESNRSKTGPSGTQATALSHPNQESISTKKTAVVIVTSVSQLPQLSALAHSWRTRSAYDLVVVALIEDHSGIMKLCSRTDITLLTYDLKCLVGNLVLNERELPDRVALKMLPPTPAAGGRADGEECCIQDAAMFAVEVAYQAAYLASARDLLKQVSANLLVLFEDNAEYLTGIWIAAAQELSVASVILPYTIADQLEPAEAHYNNSSYWADNGLHNRLARAVAPQWLFFYRDRWLLRRKGASILAAEALGVAPPLPWILNSSKANAIAVESDAMYRHYAGHGIPETQLVMTGSLTDDLICQADKRRDLLRAELGLDDRPVLLCSFPPDQLSANRQDCEFAEFQAIVEFWLGALSKLDWQVLVKPHPAMRAEDIARLGHHRLRVVTEHETTSLLPLCDLYNPSVSSTIRWALACGKPVLNYDVYRYKYQDFAAEPAVLTVHTAAEFSEALLRLTRDAEILKDYTYRAQMAAARWGMMDGRSTERIVGLFDRLAERCSRLAGIQP